MYTKNEITIASSTSGQNKADSLKKKTKESRWPKTIPSQALFNVVKKIIEKKKGGFKNGKEKSIQLTLLIRPLPFLHSSEAMVDAMISLKSDGKIDCVTLLGSCRAKSW